jgi:membrane protein YqaA with SNARE-associated domain
MNKPHIPAWLRRVLVASAGHPYYPFVVALIAFGSTVTFSFPFIVALIPAVLIAPKRWLALGLLCGLASGLGEAVVLARYPELADVEHWQTARDWLNTYGLWAIALIAGSPMPQTPALFVYSLAGPSFPGVMLAVGAGKTVKYVCMAWLTAKYPARFIDYK